MLPWGASCFFAFVLLGMLIAGALHVVTLAVGQPNAEWPHWTMLGVWLLGIVVSVGGTIARRSGEKTKPCKHGTKGASLAPARCSECVAEAEKQEAERKAEAVRRATEERLRRQREYDEYRARIRLPSYLERMDAREFELLVCDLYRHEGYDVKATPFSCDSGVDGYLRRDGKLYLLQCKRTKGSVGQPVLRDLFGTMVHERAAGGIVVTTGRVSRQAREWAKGKPIQVIELHELSDMTRRLYSECEVMPPKWQPPSRFG